MIKKNLFLFAKINPKSEYFQDAKDALINILEQTKKEEGCIQFELLDDSKYLYLYEEWIDEEALNKHYQEEYTKEVFEKYQNWLSEDVEISKMYKVFK